MKSRHGITSLASSTMWSNDDFELPKGRKYCKKEDKENMALGTSMSTETSPSNDIGVHIGAALGSYNRDKGKPEHVTYKSLIWNILWSKEATLT